MSDYYFSNVFGLCRDFKRTQKQGRGEKGERIMYWLGD